MLSVNLKAHVTLKYCYNMQKVCLAKEAEGVDRASTLLLQSRLLRTAVRMGRRSQQGVFVWLQLPEDNQTRAQPRPVGIIFCGCWKAAFTLSSLHKCLQSCKEGEQSRGNEPDSLLFYMVRFSPQIPCPIQISTKGQVGERWGYWRETSSRKTRYLNASEAQHPEKTSKINHAWFLATTGCPKYLINLFFSA